MTVVGVGEGVSVVVTNGKVMKVDALQACPYLSGKDSELVSNELWGVGGWAGWIASPFINVGVNGFVGAFFEEKSEEAAAGLMNCVVVKGELVH